MTTHYLTLSPHEVRAALRGELELVVRPVKPQPANGLKWNAVVLNGYGGWTDEHGKPFPCPLGAPGDRLVGRETWGQDMSTVHYKASADNLDMKWIRWRSPATMPAWASRITLEVVGVRCVRINSVSNQDILSAGMRSESCNICPHVGGSGCGQCMIPARPFIDAWNNRYVKRGLGWDKNPWAWAAKVKRVEG